MHTRILVALAGVVLLAVVLSGSGVAQTGDGADSTGGAEANEGDLSVGEELSVAVSAQRANVRDTVENGAFERGFERNGTEAVNERARSLRKRLNSVRERKKALEQQRAEGEISEDRYRAKVAVLSVEAESVNRSSGRVVEEAKSLERVGERGVDIEKLREIKRNASELTGTEASEIARRIAGRTPDGVGPGADGDDGEDRGAKDRRDTDGGGDDREKGERGPPDGVGRKQGSTTETRGEEQAADGKVAAEYLEAATGLLLPAMVASLSPGQGPVLQ